MFPFVVCSLGLVDMCCICAPPLTLHFPFVSAFSVDMGHSSHTIPLFLLSCVCHVRDFFMTKLVQLKRYALTPVVDLINHQSGVESDVSYNYFYGYFAVTTQVSSRWW